MLDKYINLISIIVPVYNNDQYIDRCLSSIRDQTYKNLDIIVVDDGSSDNSGQICDKFQKTDKRFRVFHIKNQGVSHARNLGIEKSKGKYIGFVDSDDYICPTMYEELLKKIVHESSDCVVCSYYNKAKKVNSQLELEGRHCTNNFEILVKCGSNCWNKLFKKEIIDSNNVYFPNISVGEDSIFVYKYLISSKFVSFLKDSLYFYNDNEKSVMHENNIEIMLKKYLVEINLFTKLFCTNNKNKLSDQYNLWKACTSSYSLLTMISNNNDISIWQKIDLFKKVNNKILSKVNINYKVNLPLYKKIMVNLLLAKHYLLLYYYFRLLNVFRTILLKGHNNHGFLQRF